MDFTPSSHGFHFSNSFEDGPVIHIDLPLIGKVGVGNAGGGLCGGMVFAALDYFHAGKSVRIPSTSVAPQQGEPLFDYIAKRLIDSFDLPFGVMHYYAWMSHRGSLYSRTVDECLAIDMQLEVQGPVPIALIRAESIKPTDLGKNHQVLALGVQDTPGGLKLPIYDPNYPDRDDIVITLQKSEIVHSEDGPFRGLFMSKYQYQEPITL